MSLKYNAKKIIAAGVAHSVSVILYCQGIPPGAAKFLGGIAGGAIKGFELKQDPSIRNSLTSTLKYEMQKALNSPDFEIPKGADKQRCRLLLICMKNTPWM